MISRRPSVRRLRPKASPVRTVGRRWFATYCPADLGVSQSNVGLEDRRIVGRRRSGSQVEARDSVKVERPPRRTPGPQGADEGVTPSSATRAKGRHRSSTVISARCRSRRTELGMLPSCSWRQPSRKGYVDASAAGAGVGHRASVSHDGVQVVAVCARCYRAKEMVTGTGMSASAPPSQAGWAAAGVGQPAFASRG